MAKKKQLPKLSHLLFCLLILPGLGNGHTIQAQETDDRHDQGSYTIPLPQGWRVGGSSGHSSYQSDTSGCFYMIDQYNGESLALLCGGEQPWESVAARAEQLVNQYGSRLHHERRTTPRQTVYHLLSDKGEVLFLLVEGKDLLLHITIEAEGRRKAEVVTKLVSLLDQIIWRPVPADRRRLTIAPPEPSLPVTKADKAVTMLCRGEVFDINLLTEAMQQHQLDLATRCPHGDRMLIEMLAFAPDAQWPPMLSLVKGAQRQSLLNLRLGVLAARRVNAGSEGAGLDQLAALAVAGAQPVTLGGSIASTVLSALLPEQAATADAEKIDKAIAVQLHLLNNLAALDNKAPQLGSRFWSRLLPEKAAQPLAQEQWQLPILHRLHQRFGTVAATEKGELTPLQQALSNASPAVVKAVAQLTPSDPLSAGMLSAAIAEDRWLLLASLRTIDLGPLEKSEYQSVLVAATRKTLATGALSHLQRLLALRKAEDSTLDWLLNVVLQTYDDEFAAFGWKTVEFLQQAGASTERVLANPRSDFDSPCNSMLGSPERFRGLVERGLPVQTLLPVLGRPGLKVNALTLFFMCRDPRSAVALNEELGELLIQRATPQDFNTYNPAIKAFPLALAAQRSPKLARLMLTRGANANAQDAHGNTVLMMEAASNEPDTVRFLLEAGADVNRTNKLGINALGYAECFDAKEVVTILKPHSAQAEGVARCRTAVEQAQPRTQQPTGKAK